MSKYSEAHFRKSVRGLTARGNVSKPAVFRLPAYVHFSVPFHAQRRADRTQPPLHVLESPAPAYFPSAVINLVRPTSASQEYEV